jgi:hypothetical protein
MLKLKKPLAAAEIALPTQRASDPRGSCCAMLTVLCMSLWAGGCREKQNGVVESMPQSSASRALAPSSAPTSVPNQVASGSSRGSTVHPVPPADPGSTIWEGVSRGVRIQWTTRDLSARSDAEQGDTWSLASDLRREYEKASPDSEGSGPCRAEEKITLLSVVGTLVSFERATYSECAHAAHPGGETRYGALDLKEVALHRAAARPVELGDLFPPQEVFDALSKDGVVRKALASPGHGKGAAPKTLPELTKRLSLSVLDEPCATFPLDLMRRFAFHHLDARRVAVRVGVPGAGPCREQLTQLGLLLDALPSVAPDLAEAADLHAGFLMKDATKIAKGRVTQLEFGNSAAEVDKARESL